MKTAFKISEAQDCEGRLPYKTKLYVSLDDEHFTESETYFGSHVTKHINLTDSGKTFLWDKFGFRWSYYAEIQRIPQREIDAIRHNYKLMRGVLAGRIDGGEVKY